MTRQNMGKERMVRTNRLVTGKKLHCPSRSSESRCSSNQGLSNIKISNAYIIKIVNSHCLNLVMKYILYSLAIHLQFSYMNTWCSQQFVHA